MRPPGPWYGTARTIPPAGAGFLKPPFLVAVVTALLKAYSLESPRGGFPEAPKNERQAVLRVCHYFSRTACCVAGICVVCGPKPGPALRDPGPCGNGAVGRVALSSRE